MNWTGGTRARHNRPSSDTTRLQKRYFAKVRAAQSSTHPVAHAGSSSVFGGEDSASGPRKRKRPPIPALDIIVPKNGDVSQGEGVKKRRLLETTHGVTSTPTSSVQSFGNMSRRGGRLRSKKQLLLEKDDWVCTALARPLVLKNQGDDSNRGRRRAEAPNVAKPLGLDLCEPFTAPAHPHRAVSAESEKRVYIPPVYPSPERRAHLDTGDDSDIRPGRAFRNLSDGGYVQIGGSTQAGNRTATPHSLCRYGSTGREMSDISEETMLFDLDGRQETPSRPSAFTTVQMPRRVAGGIFGRDYQVPFARDGSEDMVYYPKDSRLKHIGQDGYGVNQFPSSPLAPYSQNIHSNGLLIPGNNFLACNQEPTDTLIGEIEKAVAEVDSTSSPGIQSTIHLGLEPVTPPPTRVQLLPAGNGIWENSGYQEKRYSRRPTHDHYQVLESNRQNPFGLNRLLEEEAKSTQNLSLMAYASSPENPLDDEEGESWMLGSNISLGLYETREADTNIHPQEFDDDWGAFLRSSTPAGGVGVEQQKAEDDAQSYLDKLGIWEKQSAETGSQALVESQYSDNEAECRDFYHNGEDVVLATEIPNSTEFLDSRDSPTGPHPLPGEGKVASSGPFEEPLDESRRVGDKALVDSCGVNGEVIAETLGVAPQTIMKEPDKQKPTSPQEIHNVISDRPTLNLDLDGDEDNAWRMFVFAGLDDKSDQEESITALKPPKPKSRKSSLRPISQFSRIRSPELQLPSPLQPPDLRSTAGATVGSGSLLDSGDGTSVAGTPTAQRKRSKFFDTGLSSSSPVSVCTRLNRQKGERRLITDWLGKGSKKKGRNKEGNEEENNEEENGNGAEIDVIEEW